MSRQVTGIWLAMGLAMGACTPLAAPQPVLPTFVAPDELGQPAVPEPNEAYPTARAAESNTTETVSGFSMDLRRAWRDGKQVNAEVCFSLPDSSDWTIWAAHYEYNGNAVSEFSTSFVGREQAQPDQPAQRCDELSFYVPPDADLTNSSLTIESVGAYPAADEYCTVYLPKIQQALSDRGLAISLECQNVDGASTLQIVGLPEGMTREQAEELVFSDEFYTVRGPWSFPVTFGP